MQVPEIIDYSWVDFGTPGGQWRKILFRGVLKVLSGVKGGFRHSGGGGSVVVSQHKHLWKLIAENESSLINFSTLL